MSVIVQKYGGMCLETPEKIKAVAGQLAALHQKGHHVVVVVSAMGRTTDELVKLAYQVSPHPVRRELDMLLTTGERVSMALMSMALSDLGVPAISFTGSQAGVLTDESHSQARIVDVRPIRVREELDRGKIVVLAGFQGVNPKTKEITTLGRGGSDTTAVAMAGALSAARCEIIKEVDGVCSADPKIVPHCRSLKDLDFSSLAEMCFWGAKVLHFRSVELALNLNIPLVIKKWGADSESTLITKKVEMMETGKVLSVNSLSRVEHLEIDCANLGDGFEALAEHLAAKSLAWPQILASAHDGAQTRMMVTADAESLDRLIQSLVGASAIRSSRERMCCVAVTCSGSPPMTLTRLAIQTLHSAGLPPQKVIMSPLSVSFILPAQAQNAAIRLLHDRLT